MAVFIGDPVETEVLTREQQLERIKEIEPEEAKNMLIKLRPEREEQFKSEYDCVVVMDFGDDYHKTEEERERENQYYKLFRDYRVGKAKYSKIPEFIVAYRKALKILDAVCANQEDYDETKFKKLVLKGKIEIAGLVFPKLKKRAAKNISMEYLSEYILSDGDPKEIFRDVGDVLLDNDELQRISETISEEEKRAYCTEPDVDELRHLKKNDKDEVTEGCAKLSSEKETQQLIKEMPELLNCVKDIVNREKRSIDSLKNYVYDITSGELDELELYEGKHREKKLMSKYPKFKGDIMNKNDYRRYMNECFEYEQNCIKEDYNGKYKTKQEIRDIELAQELEENGWNMRNLYDNREKEKKLKKLREMDKRRKQKLKKKLVKLQSRKNRRLGMDVDKVPSKKQKKEMKKYKKKAKKNIEKVTKSKDEDSVFDFRMGGDD